MSYRIDDDENRIQELEDKIDQLEIQTFSPEVVARNQSTRNTGVQSGDGAVANPFPLRPLIRDFGTIGSLTLDGRLDRVDSHTMKMVLDGDLTVAFTEPPTTKRSIAFVLDITQDGTGSHTITFPGALNVSPTPTPSTTANQRTVMNFQTTDGGASYQMTSQIII